MNTINVIEAQVKLLCYFITLEAISTKIIFFHQIEIKLACKNTIYSICYPNCEKEPPTNKQSFNQKVKPRAAWQKGRSHNLNMKSSSFTTNLHQVRKKNYRYQI